MDTNSVKNPQKLRIEIWMNDNMEWSLDGDGSQVLYSQAAIKLRSLFPGEEEVKLVLDKDDVRTVPITKAIDEVTALGGEKNIMLCDKKYEKMMMFVYNG
jgi:hypothetical protein